MIGQAIKRIRKHQKQTQYEFGESIGVTQSCISSIERNSSYPSMKILKKISDKMNIPIFMLVWAGIGEEEVNYEYKKEFSTLKPVVDVSLSLIFGNSIVFNKNDGITLFPAEQHVEK